MIVTHFVPSYLGAISSVFSSVTTRQLVSCGVRRMPKHGNGEGCCFERRYIRLAANCLGVRCRKARAQRYVPVWLREVAPVAALTARRAAMHA